jgi:polar amino acid transport system ATP-binding protein
MEEAGQFKKTHHPIGPPAQLFGNTGTPRLQQFLKPWFERSLSAPGGPAQSGVLLQQA